MYGKDSSRLDWAVARNLVASVFDQIKKEYPAPLHHPR